MDISFEHVTVKFPDGTVGLSGINLQIKQGEFIALVGPSGSGKTTLLRTLAGFVTPSFGHVEIGGKDMTQVPPEQRNLGMVFQQHAVWPHMSVAKNVGYPLARAGVLKTETAERVSHALELVGLSGFQARRPASLSGGQRQRVALARAIVGNPSVLLLDEALSALDEPLRDGLRRELVALTKTHNLTTVHVTHDRKEALAVADRVVVLDHGSIVQIAPPAELLARPATPEVAAFIADATVVPAQLRGERIEFLGLDFAREEVEISHSAAEPCAAILPHRLTVVPASRGHLRGTVTSVLFDGHASSITVSAAGHSFRATAPLGSAHIGQEIGLRLATPLVYA